MNFSDSLFDISKITEQLFELDPQVEALSDLMKNCFSNKKILTIFGNGGSASDAQHWAAELVGSYSDPRRCPLPAIALTTDTSIITALSNDFSFDDIFCRQLLSFADVNGMSIGLSTSGTSKNVIDALKLATSHGAYTCLISGNKINALPWLDLHIRFPSSQTPVIQTLTQLVYHTSCAVMDEHYT